MITTNDYLSLANGELTGDEAKAVVHLSSAVVVNRFDAMNLGWLACRGLGYERAAGLNPWPNGELAMAFDAGIAQHEIENDDYSDITDTLTDRYWSKAQDLLLFSAAVFAGAFIVLSVPF